jgi:hypothetical protein
VDLALFFCDNECPVPLSAEVLQREQHHKQTVVNGPGYVSFEFGRVVFSSTVDQYEQGDGGRHREG